MSNASKYEPYAPTPQKQDGCNDLAENRGPNSTEPYRPNGWENFERNTFESGKK
jgi:hypothetical protein